MNFLHELDNFNSDSVNQFIQLDYPLIETPPMSPLYSIRPYNRINRINFLEEPFDNYEPFRDMVRATMRIRRRHREILELEEIKELESDNENFIKEKNIKFDLYPLYINWKKIETKKYPNEYFNIFKLFGYFGEAIFEILKETIPKSDDYYTNKNFLIELIKLYQKDLTKEEIEQNKFYKKLLDIFDDVISLVKNKIVIFKEIPIFLTVFKLYQLLYSLLKDKKNCIESLKYQFIILNYLKSDEYDLLYDKYLKVCKTGRFLGYNIFRRSKDEYIKQIKREYKALNL